MSRPADRPETYDRVTRALHWGMAALLAAQFLSAAAHWGLPRGHIMWRILWSYHLPLGIALFFLVLVRGVWGLANMSRRPRHSGVMGRVAVTGHIILYTLMVVVPAVRILAAAGNKKGFNLLGISVFPDREEHVTWMRAPADWHGEMGWILGLLVAGHIAIALIWHQWIRRDDTLKRMFGRSNAAR
ncbi:cytochrome b [Ruegeria sp. HKCCD8929]|uniref:cytochrome b n=1 Tax=Ruegeria sp. HKCCD8929 TaxID=2683006 RepID=UPI001487CE48|nr:cytochrome b [Ruegeria sp. HKCCD8929]